MDDLEFGEELFVLVGERPWGKTCSEARSGSCAGEKVKWLLTLESCNGAQIGICTHLHCLEEMFIDLLCILDIFGSLFVGFFLLQQIRLTDQIHQVGHLRALG